MPLYYCVVAMINKFNIYIYKIIVTIIIIVIIIIVVIIINIIE